MADTRRVQWVEHRGRKILRVDLRNLDRPGMLAALEEYDQAMRPAPERSVSLLALFGEAEFHPSALTRARAIMMDHVGKLRRSAHLGMEGILRIAMNGFYDAVRLMGQDTNDRGRVFPPEKEGEALDWLVED